MVAEKKAANEEYFMTRENCTKFKSQGPHRAPWDIATAVWTCALLGGPWLCRRLGRSVPRESCLQARPNPPPPRTVVSRLAPARSLALRSPAASACLSRRALCGQTPRCGLRQLCGPCPSPPTPHRASPAGAAPAWACRGCGSTSPQTGGPGQQTFVSQRSRG